MSDRAAIYCVLLFVVSLVGLIRYRQLSFPFRILVWSVVLSFLTFLLDRYFIIKYKTNAPILHVQVIEKYIFYSTVYYYLFKNGAVKKIILISILIFVIFFPINGIFLQPFFKAFPTNIDTLAQTLYAGFSLLLFKEMLDYPVKMNIVKQSIFWFNTAMLFYSTTGFFLLGLSNYVSKGSFDDGKLIYYSWWGIEYLFLILICCAFMTHSFFEQK